jgi:hypothetical protein
MAKTKKFNNIMIDLETLGTRADSVIMSIGAVKFDLDSREIDDKALYVSVSIDSNHEVAPRHISEDTVIWWLKQGAAAQEVFIQPKTTLYAALQDLEAWIDHPDYKVWSNGADFDIPMIAHAFTTFGLDIPWKFWNTGCFRTMKGLPNAPKAAAKPRVAHNAMYDALAQAEHLQLIWNAMYGGERKAA